MSNKDNKRKAQQDLGSALGTSINKTMQTTSNVGFIKNLKPKYAGLLILAIFALFLIDEITAGSLLGALSDNETSISTGTSGGFIEPGKEATELSKSEAAEQWVSVTKKNLGVDGLTILEVDGGDRSGDREALVQVDVGYGDRDYYAFTNEYGQLVAVIAYEIILQDDDTEPVTDKGRYYADEAYVPGTESPDLDQGHVIADSLGGVSNAYNITPQESTLNRYGNQAYIEEAIRDAGGCTEFICNITYENTTTMIPSEYAIAYKIDDEVFYDSFFNMDPDQAREMLDNK